MIVTPAKTPTKTPTEKKNPAEEQDEPVYIARLSERLMPPQLIQATKLALNKHVDIGMFQSLPLPPQLPKRPRRKSTKSGRVLTEQESNTAESTAISPPPPPPPPPPASRSLISTTSLDEIPLLSCGCALTCKCDKMFEYICQRELDWFISNIAKDDTYVHYDFFAKNLLLIF